MSVADEKETDTENAREEDKQILDRDAQPTSVCSAGDMGGRVIDEEESEDEDSSIVGTPHSKVVRKQRYASKLLKRRINNVNEPVAQVFLPEETDWKIHNNTTAETNQKSELSNYRKHFCDKEHLNYRCHDAVLGPILISVMQESATTELIVRTSNGTVTESLTVESPDPATLSPDSVLNLVKILAPDITTETISHIDDEQIQELLLTYDDNYHQLLKRNKYAFGVLYQRSGQASEQEIFGNVGHCDKFEEFLLLLGEHLHHSEDDTLGFYVREWEEVMLKFYVLTRLPHSKTDSQQCARKARIGNCVVCVVFQAEEATFSPEIITSQFLHAYIVIQPVQSDQYKVSIVSKVGVPEFGPKMESVIRLNKENIGEFFSKLINGEQAAYKIGKLAILRQKYRLAGLSHIISKLDEREREEVGETGKWRVCSIL